MVLIMPELTPEQEIHLIEWLDREKPHVVPDNVKKFLREYKDLCDKYECFVVGETKGSAEVCTYEKNGLEVDPIDWYSLDYNTYWYYKEGRD